MRGARDRDRLALGGQRVPGARPVQAGDGDEIARHDRSGGRGGMSGECLQRVEALLAACAGVDEDGVRGQRARDHLAQRHLPRVAVGERLGHREQHVAIGVVGDLGRRGPGQHGDGRHRAGCRAELLDQPGQPVHPDSRQARTAQDGEDIARGDAAGQALRQLAVVDRLAAEVALHEAVVADDDALDELFVHLVLLVDQLVGDGALVARRRDGPVDGRVRRRGVVVGGRVAQQVDDPVEVGFGPDGQFHRRHPGSEAGADVGQGAIEVRPLAIQLVDDDHPGQAEPGRGAPGVFGLGLDAVGGADDHDGQVGAGQSASAFRRRSPRSRACRAG